MRLHITLEDELVAQLDSRVGRRRRSAFISATIRRALEDERRWEDIEAGFGALADRSHDWDADPAGWVQAQRHGDLARVG
jgi:metal-responsive CopG/Arc/MetJ family transcriptional regulator